VTVAPTVHASARSLTCQQPRLDPMGPAGNCLCASGEFTKASVFGISVHHGLVKAQGNLGGETRRRELRLMARIRGDTTGNRVFVSEGHGCTGNGVAWKTPAPARCFGIVGARSKGVRTVLVPCGNATVASVTRVVSKGPRSNVSSVPWIHFGGSMGWRCRLRPRTEQEGERLRSLHHRRRDERVKAHSRGQAQGSIGSGQRGNASTGQRTSGGETPEVGAASGERSGFDRRVTREQANHERGWNIGEHASNGVVTVSTSPGGKSSEGSVSVGMVGCRRQRRQSACNRTNPMVGSGMQQAHTVVCGRNRRSRAKRQGRICGRGWQPLRRFFGNDQQDAAAHIGGGAIFEGTS